MRNKTKQHEKGNTMNEYERIKLLRVQENQQRLQELGIKSIANSLTSLAESQKRKKQKKQALASDKDREYVPEFDINSEEDNEEEVSAHVVVPKKRRPQYIAPMSMNKYANLAKQRVIAPNVTPVLPFKEGCERNGQVDVNVAKNYQSKPTTTMGELILNNKGLQGQMGVCKQPRTDKHKSKGISISSGKNSKLFLVDNDYHVSSEGT